MGLGLHPLSLFPLTLRLAVSPPPFAPLSGTTVHTMQVRDALVSERDRLYARLQEIPFLEPYPSHANFILAKVGLRRRRAAAGREGFARVRAFTAAGKAGIAPA